MSDVGDNAVFGPYLKELRMTRRMTLWGFVRQASADPRNVSRMDRGGLRGLSPPDEY